MNFRIFLNNILIDSATMTLLLRFVAFCRQWFIGIPDITQSKTQRAMRTKFLSVVPKIGTISYLPLSEGGQARVIYCRRLCESSCARCESTGERSSVISVKYIAETGRHYLKSRILRIRKHEQAPLQGSIYASRRSQPQSGRRRKNAWGVKHFGFASVCPVKDRKTEGE